MKKIRIASGQGFWGDWLEAPIRQIQGGEIDYLVLDYLAEVTMSILAKQKERNPDHGYAKDFVALIDQVLKELHAKNIKVITNAGGMNPQACAKAIAQLAKDQNIPLRIAVIEGDNLLPSIDSLAQSKQLAHMETGKHLSSIASEIKSANVYLGCDPIVEALSGGAQIVVAGRLSDPSMVLGPLVYEFSWAENDWDLRASGTLAGHLIECGAQASGGNCSIDWEQIPELENIGFPIVEVCEDGSFEIYKHPGTGGRINLAGVKEQMIYEIGDPSAYITPDVVVDFTSANLTESGTNRVRVTGVQGGSRSDKLKVSISYHHGFRAVGTLVYSWPDAVAKAQRAEEIITARIAQLGLRFEKTLCEIVGANACHGSLAEKSNSELAEVVFRYAVQGENFDAVKRFTREIAPLVLGGPPFATAYSGGKGAVTEVFAYWPALIARKDIATRVEFIQ